MDSITDTSASPAEEPFGTPHEQTVPSGDAVVDVHDVDANLSFRSVDPVDVHIENLSVDIDVSPRKLTAIATSGWGRGTKDGIAYKQILKSVSASMPHSTVSAILGASGSGKTSLLNTLSHRIEGGRLRTTGKVLYNGHADLRNIRSAYVMQQDVLLPTLTVRETLRYAAELRLPPPATAKERSEVVEDVILELGLKDCADTRIGNSVHKGCSGGEKRRTSLAVQMLANPSVLFLDEVTTGLDASTAYQLMRTLRSLARKGRTIIITIHQPRSEIWSIFDSVLVLANGSPVYSGQASDCLPYFQGIGYHMPAFMNPAEYVIDQAAIDNRSSEAEATSSARVQQMTETWKAYFQKQTSLSLDSNKVETEKADTNGKASLEASRRQKGTKIDHHAGFARQVHVLTKRTFTVTWRDPYGMAGILFEATMMALISGLIWLQLDGSLQGIRSREGAIYNGSALQGYLIMIYEIFRLTSDIQVFDREHGEGIVSIPAFLLSRRIARFPLEDISVPFIYSTIFYFMVGFRSSVNQFFLFLGVLILMHHIAVNVAMVCVALSRDFATASLFGNSIFTLQSLASGFFVQPNQIPPWVRWLKWTAYTFYSYSAVAVSEFTSGSSVPPGNNLYDCPYPGGVSNPNCDQWTGRYVMRNLEIPFNDLTKPVLALVGWLLAFFFGSGAILYILKVRIGVSQARKTDTDHSAGKETMLNRLPDGVRHISIRLHDYTLNLEKRNWTSRRPKIISTLKAVNAEFRPFQLNVIMGPSGSGKTSLLNLLSRRLHNSFSTKYVSEGHMTFNEAVPSAKVVRSICSYVCQDDDQLLPYLTVRENLRFAAALRLPSHLSKAEKRSQAESVLAKLGLRDCADTIVGNDLVKGISGGEKRRTTIAIQILTDPRVLFLDEPTSGLDAFTASSIVEVLRGLVSEGRTLILTMHQTRSDLFQYFGSVLLLAQGGSVLYSGKGSEMLPHFAVLGHKCPVTTNPADFALDLISVNLQNEHREATSREKVRSLILSWDQTRPPVEHTTSHIATPAELGSLARDMTPLRIAFPVLMHRSIINFRRNNVAVIARTTQVFAFSVIITLFFAPLKNSQASVTTRLGFLQEITPLYFVGMLQCVAVYPSERDVFYREHDDNAYSIEAFFLQYTLAEIPFEIFTSLLFGLLTVFAAGLPRTATLYFVMVLNGFAIVNCGESLGIMFNTLFTHTGFAINVTSVILSVATMMSGVMSLQMPAFLQAFNYLSPIKYALGNLAPYSFRGVVFTCEGDQRLGNGRCPIETGEDVLRLYNFETNAGLNLMALGVCVVVYRVVAYLILKARRSRWEWGERALERFHRR